MSKIMADEMLVDEERALADSLQSHASVPTKGLAAAPAMLTAMGATLKRATPDAVWGKVMATLRARWYLRGADIGQRTRIWGRPFVRILGEMRVGEGVQFLSTVAKLEIVVDREGTLEIGDGVFINYGVTILVNQQVRIGARSKLGMHVMIMDNAFHHLDPMRRSERPASAPVMIEENVWLAARVIVLPGVTIGANSVIGAGSVVTKSVPPNVFAAGAPARVIKNL